jgi:hypothetical protein
MHDEVPTQVKDFESLINQMTNLSETRDKQISEIDDILDRLKRNKRPSSEPKQGVSPVSDQPDVITRIRTLIDRMDYANEKLQAISNRINELI